MKKSEFHSIRTRYSLSTAAYLLALLALFYVGGRVMLEFIIRDAALQTFIPEKGAFETEVVRGALEMVSLLGNVISDENGNRYYHAHAMYSTRKDGVPCFAGGHLKSSTVLYTAEITLQPVEGGSIGYTFNPETGTGFWKLH